MKELLKKKGVRIGLLIIILLVAMGIIGTNVQSAQRRDEYNGYIEAAEKYLSDLDYEQAIAEYRLALEIEPKSEEVLSGLEQTYLAYAKSYADTGDYERAMDILEEGYAVIQRESFKEQIEEYADRQMAWKEVEAETAAETKAEQVDDIKQMVESDEFYQQQMVLVRIFANFQSITDGQVRELCWPMIEALERYRELYPENGRFYEGLSDLYYLVGEYELCAQTLKEFRERFPDNGNVSSYYKDETSEITRDEYGRMISFTVFYYDGNDYHGKAVAEYEYGQNGKLIRYVSTNDAGMSDGVPVITTVTTELEYDSEGRLSKRTSLQEENPGESWKSVSTYEYSEGGVTLYEDGKDYRKVTDYVINEYGEAEIVGDEIWQESE